MLGSSAERTDDQGLAEGRLLHSPLVGGLREGGGGLFPETASWEEKDPDWGVSPEEETVRASVTGRVDPGISTLRFRDATVQLASHWWLLPTEPTRSASLVIPVSGLPTGEGSDRRSRF